MMVQPFCQYTYTYTYIIVYVSLRSIRIITNIGPKGNELSMHLLPLLTAGL